MGGVWAEQAARMDIKLPRYPVGYAVAQTKDPGVHAVVLDDKSQHASAAGSAGTRQGSQAPAYLPLCKWKKGSVSPFKKDPYFAATLREAKEYSLQFCKECKPLLIASSQVQVAKLFR